MNQSKINIAVGIVTTLTCWLLFEYGLTKLDDYFNHIEQINLLSDDELIQLTETWINSENYHPYLGWDKIKKHDFMSDSIQYIAQSFGDSFVLSGHDSNNKTWQDYFYDISGYGIINHGVGGYGLDQAVLKYESNDLDTKNLNNLRYCILGLYTQEFRRLLSFHTYYYFKGLENQVIFKPIFIKDQNSYKLIEPPPLETFHNTKTDYINFFKNYNITKQHDYWYNDNLKKPVLKFPRILNILSKYNYLIHFNKQKKYLAPFSFVNEDAIKLTKYLINRFVRACNNNETEPIMLLMYSFHELKGMDKGYREDLWLIEYLTEEHIKFIDTYPIFEQYIFQENDILSLFCRDSHYNNSGDSLVAKTIHKYFNEKNMY